MTSVAAVLQSCQNRNDKKCPYKPFGETQLLVNISLQSALDSHKLLRQLLSSFNDGDGKSQENIQMKEKNICLVSHFLRQSLELLLGKQNKELLITINFTLKISSHFSCFNMSSHLVKDSFHMLNSLPRDIPDRINTVALFLQACSKLVNRHVSTTRKQEEQDDVIHLLDCICAYLQDDCIALISDNNIQNYIAFCCDSVISYVFTSDKVLTSSSHSAQLEAVLKISVRHQLKCRLDLSRTLDAV